MIWERSKRFPVTQESKRNGDEMRHYDGAVDDLMSFTYDSAGHSVCRSLKDV